MNVPGILVLGSLLLACARAGTDPGSAGGEGGNGGWGRSGAGGSGMGGGGAGGSGGATTPDAGTGMAAPDSGRSADGGSADGTPVASVCPQGMTWGAPFTGNPMATKVKDGFNFVEGPLWLAEQNALLFSDMNFGGGNTNGPPSRLHKFTPPDKFEVFIMDANSNGLALHPNGKVLACTHDTQSLSFYDPVSKARAPVPGGAMYIGRPFNSPNDATVRGDGNVYFTDPDWQQANRPGQDRQRVYRLSPQGEISVVDERTKPNGVALSPDGRTLYVGAVDGAIKKHPVDAAGAVGPGQMFAQVSGPDGFAVDCGGNLYVAGGGGVHVFAPDGQRLGMIGGTGGGASNAAFGDADRRTLYITHQGALYAIRLAVPGFPY